MRKIFLISMTLLIYSIQTFADKPQVFQEAQFYEKLKKNYVKCLLCPNYCVIKPGDVGICRARQNIDGKLYTIVYNKPVAIHVDPVEKKPLYHFYPGSQILSLATAGCNLRCNFCQNWTISQIDPRKADSYELSAEEIVLMAKEYNCKGIAFTYTEPTIFFEYMLDIAKLAKAENIKTIWVTCGYINPQPLKKLAPYIDAANIDLKGFSEEFYRTYTTGTLEPVLETIKTAKQENIFIEITNLVIPQANDDPIILKEMLNWLKENLGTDIPLHFSRFFPNYKLTNRPPTPLKTLNDFYQTAIDQGFNYVYIGNAPDLAEDTFCPNCGKKIIDRSGYFIKKIEITDGKCNYCGAKIPGSFD